MPTKTLFTITFGLIIAGTTYGSGLPCAQASLDTYLNGGSTFSCTEAGGMINVTFNHDLIPAYAGLALLSSNNTAVLPANINVVPGAPGLEFKSSAFSES